MTCCEIDTLQAGFVLFTFRIFQKYQCYGHHSGNGFINYLGSLSKWTQTDLYDRWNAQQEPKGSTDKIVCLFKKDEKKYVK